MTENMNYDEYEAEAEMASEWAYRAPTAAEAHSQWHAEHGATAVCPLDCGAGEGGEDETVDLDAVDVTPAAPAAEVTVRSENTATERQISLINKLKTERNIDGTDARRALAVSRELWKSGIFDKRAASRLIDDLMAAPKTVVHMDYSKGGAVARASQEETSVAAGRYALDFGPDHEGINQIRFYKVDRPTEGRWAGRVFVKRYESDEEVRISRQEQADVLSRIEKDPEALARYGQEIGRCGRCGKVLTNDESREIGIGPECRKKM